MTLPYFPEDIQDFLSILFKHKVRYLIVGAEAVIYHGFARLTGDIDIFFEPSPKNRRSLFYALQEFWAGPVPGIGSLRPDQEQGSLRAAQGLGGS
jgi:hypothetical protein